MFKNKNKTTIMGVIGGWMGDGRWFGRKHT